jgi:peroxiredoxin
MRYFLILSVLVFSSIVKAEPTDSVTIWGTAQEYANMHLIVQYKKNYITRDITDLQSFKVDKNGFFRFSFYAEDITKIYIALGETEGFLFVVPGEKYQIVLPPYMPLKPENKLNPFFQPQYVMLGVQDEKAIAFNEKILQFESAYNESFARDIQRIVLTNNHRLANEIIAKIDAEFPADKGSWFDTYKQYTYMNMRNFIYANKERKLIYDYFSLKPVSYFLDPYWTSFNQVFSNFFYSYFNLNEGGELKQAWTRTESFDTLVTVLGKDSLFHQRALAELIILKGMYDGFYSGNYNPEKVIRLVKRATEECESLKNRGIAIGILDKISKLRPGAVAPQISLPNLSGKEKELKDYKGKFVYLNFANTQNYACKKDFQVLQRFADLYKRDMVVVTVLTDDDPDKAKEYVKKNKFNWEFLYFNQNAKVLFDYAVKAFPTYYLIDPEGNLVFSPAPAPEENFVSIFEETYNEYRYKTLRKEKPKARTIYDL